MSNMLPTLDMVDQRPRCQQERISVPETLIKTQLKDRFNQLGLNNSHYFARARGHLRGLGGKSKLLEELVALGVVDASSLLLVPTNENLFTRAQYNVLVLPGTNSALRDTNERLRGSGLFLTYNPPENHDMHYPEGMTAFHNLGLVGPYLEPENHLLLILMNDLTYSHFNVLAMGMSYWEENEADIKLLEKMQSTGNEYATAQGWAKVGMYFHVYGFNSVNSLHLHIVNLEDVWIGHQYSKKNLSIEDVLTVLKAERSFQPPRGENVLYYDLAWAAGSHPDQYKG